MATVMILHNPRCSTSRHAMSVAEGHDVEVVEYLKTPLDRDALLGLISKLEDPAADLVRKDAFFQAQGLDEADLSSADKVADLLAEYPRLMQRPILVRGARAIIGRPKERVAEFLGAP